MGSVGVIISSVLVERLGLLIADPICSLFIATLILISVFPLLKDSAAILMLATPNHIHVTETLQKVLGLRKKWGREGEKVVPNVE